MTTCISLRLVGQSIGIVALGKKIVLIEGQHGSLSTSDVQHSDPELALRLDCKMAPSLMTRPHAFR
jgi:hypothetical protein